MSDILSDKHDKPDSGLDAAPAATLETGWRGSKELWLDAAYAALLGGGVDAVKIMPLAKGLKLSRTSFYWFFKDREQLLDELLLLWRNKNTGNLIAQTEAYAESLAEATLNVFDCWLSTSLFDTQFEYAIRNWAQQSSAIAQELTLADAARLEAICAMFLKFGLEPIAADVRSRALYLTQIGYISMASDEDLHLRMMRVPDYVEIFCGKRPLQKELNRFHQRHNYSPV